MLRPSTRAVAIAALSLTAAATSLALAAEPPLPAGVVARYGSTRLRHPGLALVAFSRDTKKLLSLGFDAGKSRADLRTWDPATGEQVTRVVLDAGAVSPGTRDGVELSPDAKVLALALEEEGGARSVRLYDVATGKELRKLVPPWKEKLERSGRVAFSPDGGSLAVFGPDAPSLAVFDVATGKVRLELAGTGSTRPRLGVKSVAFSPDAKLLVVNSEMNGVRWVFDAATGRELWSGTQDDSSAFSPDGKLLASASWKTIRLLEPATGKEIRTCAALDDPDYRSVSSVVFSPDGETLATREGRKAIRILDTATLAGRRTLEAPPGEPRPLSFSPDGKKLLSSGAPGDDARGYRLELSDAATGKSQFVAAESELIQDPAFSPDGKMLAWGAGERLHLLDLETASEAAAPRGHRRAVVALELSPDGKTVASADADDRVSLWEAGTGKSLVDLDVRHLAAALAFTSDGKTLLSADLQARFRFFDTATGKRTRIVRPAEERQDPDAGGKQKESFPFAFGTSFSPDRKRAVFATVTAAALVDLARDSIAESDMRLFEDKEAPKRAGLSAALSPDGKLVAASDEEGAIRVFEAETGKALKKLAVGEAAKSGRRALEELPWSPLAFSPDGKLLAFSGTLGTISIWDLAAERRVHELPTGARIVRFSPDGATLASAGLDETVRLWDVKTGAERRKLAGHGERVTALAFSPDGKTLASGSMDTTVLVWDLAGGR